MNKKIKKKNKFHYPAFSLVEMLLVIAISGILVLSLSQIFLVNMKTFDRNKSLQKNMDEGRASLEMIAKNMRMSTLTMTNAANDTIYMFNTSQDICISYKFDASDHKLKVSQYAPADLKDPSCQNTGMYGTYTDMTSGNVIGYFNIVKTDKTPGSLRVGRAAVTMTFDTGTNTQETLETAVSFRDYQDIIQ